MNNIKALFGVLSLVSTPWPAIAQPTDEFPDTLFGVVIGSIIEENPESKEISGLSVARMTAVKSADGYGYQIFFEPVLVEPAFPYIEEEKPQGPGFIESTADQFETSFHLHAYPFLPEELEGIASMEELEAISPRELQVGLIAWSDILGEGPNTGSASRAFRYDWAKATCRDVGWHVGLEPEITDSSRDRLYRCIFTGDARELKISSENGRLIQLKYIDEIIQQKQEEIENLLSRIRTN